MEKRLQEIERSFQAKMEAQERSHAEQIEHRNRIQEQIVQQQRQIVAQQRMIEQEKVSKNGGMQSPPASPQKGGMHQSMANGGTGESLDSPRQHMQRIVTGSTGSASSGPAEVEVLKRRVVDLEQKLEVEREAKESLQRKYVRCCARNCPQLRQDNCLYCPKHTWKMRDEQSRSGGSELHFAAIYGYPQAVQALLSRGADIHAVDREGGTPLAVASASGHCDVVHMLLVAGAGVNAGNHNGDTPLHYASALGHDAVVQQLLQAGAAPASPNKANKTAFDWASENKRFSVVEKLTPGACCF